MTSNVPSIGMCAQLACIWEATARKPGNVHRYEDFEDLCYPDFLLSAAAIAKVMDDAPFQSLGTTILRSVRATREVVSTNTNLGIVLLLAPLATVADPSRMREGVEAILARTTKADAVDVYRAIHLANPGGMGKVADEDVSTMPTLSLREVMALAEERDFIARQYANGYREVFDSAVPALQKWLQQSGQLELAIVGCALELLAHFGDSLIGRKCNRATAARVRSKAESVLERGWPDDQGREAFAEFDRWLRADGHRRNPGTTADVVTASLFLALRTATITLPCPYPWCDL